MSLARLVITAVKLEGRTKSEVAREYGISRFWVQQLVHRFEVEGEAAFQPRSRRPHTSPHAIGPELEDKIIRYGKELSKKGLDAGAETIAAHFRSPGSIRCRLCRRSGGSCLGAGLQCAAAETAPLLVAPVLRRPTQRTLAGRHHPLATG